MMIDPAKVPLLKKSDCLYQDSPKVIIFNAYKLYKLQNPLRKKAKEDAMKLFLKEPQTS